MQSWVYSVNWRGLGTQPWGDLVLITTVERNVNAYLRFPLSFSGEVILNAELKTTNSIQM